MANVFGIELKDLPEGCITIEVLCIVKVLDEEGEGVTCLRVSEGLSDEEMIGLLIMAEDRIRLDAQERWEEDE